MNNQTIKAEINKKRIEAKGNWWGFAEGDIKVKGYKTWVQRIEYSHNGRIVQDGSTMDISVKQFKAFLDKCLPDS